MSDTKKIICKNCGVVNEVSDQALAEDDEDWLPCILPEGFEWNLPAGEGRVRTSLNWYPECH